MPERDSRPTDVLVNNFPTDILVLRDKVSPNLWPECSEFITKFVTEIIAGWSCHANLHGPCVPASDLNNFT